MEVRLCMFGVEGPHMLCERPARVVRMVSTSVLRASHIVVGYKKECDEWVIQSLKLSLCGDYSPPYGGGAGGGASYV